MTDNERYTLQSRIDDQIQAAKSFTSEAALEKLIDEGFSVENGELITKPGPHIQQ